MSKRVLCVSYLFPPVGGVGVMRMMKFVKFLPEFGWDVTVLTAENPSVPLRDESLLQEIPEQTMIRKARTYEPSYAVKSMVANSPPGTGRAAGSLKRLVKGVVRTIGNGVLQPDTAILWYPQAVREGLRILSEQPYDAIIATAPPFSSLLIGAALSRKTGVPLVLDYRDEWTISNAYWENKRQGRIGNWLHRKMQRHVLRAAEAVIATTPGSAAAIDQIAKDAGSPAVSTHIDNGFDPADFPAAGEMPAREDYGHGTDRFRIAFVGTLWTLTSIEPFVKALRILADRNPQLLEPLEVVVAGRQVGEELSHLEALALLPCRFVNLGFLEHNDALRLMATSDCLLQLQSDLPGIERVISSKLFEYIGARRPILAITGEGDQCDVVRELPLATACSPHDPDAVADFIATRLEAHRCGVLVETSHGDISRFERRQLTAQLAGTLDSLVTHYGGRVETARPTADRKPAEVSG